VKFLVNTPEPMWRMRVLVPREDAAVALASLQRAGVLHPEQSTEFNVIGLRAIEAERTAVNTLLGALQDVLAYAPADEMVRITRDVEVLLTRPARELVTDTRRACSRLVALHRRAQQLEDEEARWARLRAMARAFRGHPGLGTGDLGFDGDHLYSRLALLPRDEFEAIAARLESLTLRTELWHGNEEVAVFLIGRTADQAELESLVRHHGELVEIPGEDVPLGAFAARAGEELKRLAGERQRLDAEIRTRTRDELEALVLLREALRAERDRLALLSMAGAAKHVVLFEGWVPASEVEVARDRLRAEIASAYVDASEAGSAEQPPTRLRNPPLLQPFELVVRLFATPRYHEWDPTPVVAWFFAAFFGLMLGDVVYGLLLLLTAQKVLPKLANDPEAEGFVAFRQLLSLCAGVAILMGLLQGSWLGDFPTRFLGAPSLALAPALQGFYLEPMAFIVASLLVGLLHVNLGHGLMLVRGLRERQRAVVVSRSAIFLLQIGAIPWVLRLLRVDWLPLGSTGYAVAAALLGISMLMIIAASLLERGAFLGSILWVFDVSGVLGDVMSYARLAGVGLATYFLAYSFNMMATLIAGMLPDTLAGAVIGGLLAVLILLAGHLLNLLLSSITCFVHALRLCFVEFLFKFYEGGGHPYAPFRLRRRTALPVSGSGA
jgi:V/A-type H+/Na+-transporting ATPase subunit I